MADTSAAHTEDSCENAPHGTQLKKKLLLSLNTQLLNSCSANKSFFSLGTMICQRIMAMGYISYYITIYVIAVC